MDDGDTRINGPGRAAFDDLFCELLPRLYRRAFVLTNDRYAAEDALHDAYLKLVRRPQRLVDHPEPFAYALVTVVNVLRDGWRRRRRQLSMDDLGEPGWDGGFALKDAERETIRLLATLTPKQALVMLLIDVDGYTIDQAARALNLHRGTVARSRTRALDKLRSLVGDRRRDGGGTT